MVQLRTGRDLMFYRMRGRDGAVQRFSQGMLVEPGGAAHPLTLAEVQATPARTWRSPDGVAYPLARRL